MTGLDKALQEFRETVFRAVTHESETPAELIESSNARDAYRLAYDRVQESQVADDHQDDDRPDSSVHRSKEAAGTGPSEDEGVVTGGSDQTSEGKTFETQRGHGKSVAPSDGGQEHLGGEGAASYKRSDHEGVANGESETRELEGNTAGKNVVLLIVLSVVLIVVGIVILL